jgi:hypothetical protein
MILVSNDGPEVLTRSICVASADRHAGNAGYRIEKNV